MTTVLMTFAQFPACSLGCYGEWKIATPEFDAFASQSRVYENFYTSADRAGLPGLICRQYGRVARISWGGGVAASGDHFAGELKFAPGEVPELSQLQEFFRETRPELVWIDFHSAPESQEELQLAAERWNSLAAGDVAAGGEEPEFAAGLPEPVSHWEQSLLEHVVGVEQCDAAFAILLDLLEEILAPGDRLIVTASSGDARRLPDDRLAWLQSVSAPVVHLPLMVHDVECGLPERVPGFVDAVRVARYLLPGTTLQQGNHDEWNALEICSPLARALRTERWMLVAPISTDSEECGAAERELQLFHKPEDYWDVRNVAGQYPDVVDQLRSQLDP